MASPLELNQAQFAGVNKRLPQTGTASALTTAETIGQFGAPAIGTLTAGGKAAALEQIGAQQTLKGVQGSMKERATQAEDVLSNQQSIQKIEEQKDTLDIASKKQQMETESAQLQLDLSAVDADMAASLITEQLKFDRDEVDRVAFNERQLADYVLLNAKKQEQFDTWALQMQQLHSRRMDMLKMAHSVIVQQMDQTFKAGESTANQGAMRALASAKAFMEQKIAKEQADAANTAGWASAGVSILSAGIGAVASIATANPAVGIGVGTAANAALQPAARAAVS